MKVESGQVAIVTGAASGIGFALAEAFVQRGLKVALLDADTTGLAHAEAALSIRGDVLSHVGDVRDAATLEHVRDAALHRFGRVDIVCNNVGGMFTSFGPLWLTKLDGWRRTVDVNLSGVFHGIRAFVPLLVEQGRGHIVNTASMAGVSVVPQAGPYAAVKHAVVSLTETLAADLSHAGSSVGATVLCCGSVNTHAKPQARPTVVASSVSARVVEPPEVAAIVIDAIEANRLYAFTHEDSRARIERRLKPLFEHLD